MPLLTAEQIIAADDLLHENVPCPEWGGDVPVVTLTGEERDDFLRDYLGEREQFEQQGKDPDDVRLRRHLLSHALRDRDSRERLFPEPQQVDALMRKSGAVLERLHGVALRLNGMGAESEQALEKNSSTGGLNGTGSPTTTAG